uniref:Serpentine receptor class gamma n=1 Tax=Strongyloides papillosus TaxID=174720 RepID=A0A0N5BGP9_STREA
MTTNIIFLKLPKLGFYLKFLEKNNWMADVFYVLFGQETTFMFLITLLFSINRYIAVDYPTKYKHYFSKTNMIKILVIFLFLSASIGIGNFFFHPSYKINNSFGFFVPSFASTNITYYQVFYTICLFGIISITTCILNVKAILRLREQRQFSNNFKAQLFYIRYSIFIFITLACVEAFYICRVIVVQYEIHLLAPIPYFLHILAFDLTSIGDFYFLIYSR